MPLSAVSLLAHMDTARDMDITDPAMATTAEMRPFTMVDTDLPTTVDTEIPITVDTDAIVLRNGVGNTPKVIPDCASRTSRLATGSSRHDHDESPLPHAAQDQAE